MSEMDGMIQFAVMVDFSLYRKALSQGRTFCPGVLEGADTETVWLCQQTGTRRLAWKDSGRAERGSDCGCSGLTCLRRLFLSRNRCS